MTDNPNHPNNTDDRLVPPNLSARELNALGLEQVAYIKPISSHGTRAYAIHAADGSQLAVVPNRAIALATVRQNDLDPVSVH